MSRTTSDPGPLAAWPEEPENGSDGNGNGSSKRPACASTASTKSFFTT